MGSPGASSEMGSPGASSEMGSPGAEVLYLVLFQFPMQSPTVTLRISATYHSRGEGAGPQQCCIISHSLPPPLYSKVLTYYQQETSPVGFQPLPHPFPYHPQPT